MNSGADFSECRKYRYKLWRVWDESLPLLYFILMNPSTADETTNDPTIERQCRRAKQLGYGGVVILNCGAIRETDSRIAWSNEDPIGPDNYKVIENEITSNADATFIAGWGKPATTFGASAAILGIFRATGKTLYCLGTNADGSPKHPLYIGYNIEPQEYIIDSD